MKKIIIILFSLMFVSNIVFAATQTILASTYRSKLLGSLTSANMNTTADQAITMISSNYVIDKIVVANVSTNLTLAAGGIYSAASKAGTAIVAAAQLYSGLTGSTKTINPTIAVTDKRTETTLYFALTTAQGQAATADIYIFGYDLS